MGFFYLKQGENIIQTGETQISEFSVNFPSNYTDAPIEYTVEFIDDDNASGATTFTVPNCACEVTAVTEDTRNRTTSATDIIISSITPSHASQVTLDYQGGNVPFYLGYNYVTSWQERSVSSDTCGNTAYGDWKDKSTTGHSAISLPTCEVTAVTEDTRNRTTRATDIIISSITPSHASQVTLDYRGGNVPFYLGYDYVTSWQERSVSSDTCGNIAYGDWEDNSTTGHSAISFD